MRQWLHLFLCICAVRTVRSETENADVGSTDPVFTRHPPTAAPTEYPAKDMNAETIGILAGVGAVVLTAFIGSLVIIVRLHLKNRAVNQVPSATGAVTVTTNNNKAGGSSHPGGVMTGDPLLDDDPLGLTFPPREVPNFAPQAAAAAAATAATDGASNDPLDLTFPPPETTAASTTVAPEPNVQETQELVDML